MNQLASGRTWKLAMPSRIVTVNSHPIQLNIEEAFWDCLEDIAERGGKTLSGLVGEIAGKLSGDLASSLRVYVLSYYQFESGCSQGEPAVNGRVYH
jgi:predicted DNA-binding ribbon-helix-helix protein